MAAKAPVKLKPEYAQAIRELRRACSNISQFGLAIELGVQPNTVSRWEQGVRQPEDGNYFSLWIFAKAKNKMKLADWFRKKVRNDRWSRLHEKWAEDKWPTPIGMKFEPLSVEVIDDKPARQGEIEGEFKIPKRTRMPTKRR